MKELVFIYNDLMNAKKRKLSRLPLEYISDAYVEGILYSFDDRHYLVDVKDKKANKTKKVYGKLYILNNSHINLKVLDAYHECSFGIIGKNHIKDKCWRKSILATPIHYKNIEKFLRMDYNEGEGVKVITYFANLNNSYISKKVKPYNRVMCGFDINNFV